MDMYGRLTTNLLVKWVRNLVFIDDLNGLVASFGSYKSGEFLTIVLVGS